MAWMNPLSQEHQRKRWLRHDWQRYVKPAVLAKHRCVEDLKFAADEARIIDATAEQEAFRQKFLELRCDLRRLKFELALRQLQYKYGGQPRDEAANTRSGEGRATLPRTPG